MRFNLRWLTRRVCRRKLLISQNWSCFHSLNGWLWHWVHCTCMPMKSRVVLAVACTSSSAWSSGPAEIDRPVLVGTTFGGDQVVDDFVPGTVLGERLAEKFFHAAPADEARRLPADRQVCPDRRPVADVGRIVQQLVDEGGPLVGVFVLRKRSISFQEGIWPTRSR